MKRQAFLLGLFSVGGQVFLLRELVSTFNGDELFIGTALFGWLLAVAAGAFVAGRRRFPADPRFLFILGAVLLPAMMIAVRLSPRLITDIVGEIIPFGRAAGISVVAMLPVGIISGMLFTMISRRGDRPTESVAVVYLYEGIGAFIGGLAVAFSAGELAPSPMLAAFLGVIAAAGACYTRPTKAIVSSAVTAVIAITVIIVLFPSLMRYLDRTVYAPYVVAESFESHYGRHALLDRDADMIFITDNAVEAVYPDRETTENLLLPPLIYFPDAKNVLLIGRSEFGLAELSRDLGITLSAVDPRRGLNEILDRRMPVVENVHRIDDDPVKYLSRSAGGRLYDVIILNFGEPDSYYNSRYITDDFLLKIGRRLSDDGLLFIPAPHDTDRHIASEKKRALSVIHRSLKQVFPNVKMWPGTMTHFFASYKRDFDLPFDSLMAGAARLICDPQYIHPDYLYDRLSRMKTERLNSAVGEYAQVNSLTRPILPHIQALLRSRLDSFDRKFIGIMLDKPSWIIVIPAGILLAIILLLMRPGRYENFALFLYFVAGLVSLSLELICFYLYQSMAGSLYAEMAILIGAFMLGLALGTYYALKVGGRPVEYPALLMLLIATLVFLGSYDSVGSDALLAYHGLFLFVIALATGTLFVGATNRFYLSRVNAGRGVGYGWELVGSSLGALMTTTVLLPIIGLSWLLWSLVILLAVTLTGAVFGNRP